MATEKQALELNREDVDALLEMLRRSGRPMKTEELAEALKNAASRS